MTAQPDYIHYDGGTSWHGRLPKQDAFYSEAGYSISSAKVLPYVTYGPEAVADEEQRRRQSAGRSASATTPSAATSTSRRPTGKSTRRSATPSNHFTDPDPALLLLNRLRPPRGSPRARHLHGVAGPSLRMDAGGPDGPRGETYAMRVGLMADIHANREAFEACLADAERRGAQRLVLLGDYRRLWRRSRAGRPARDGTRECRRASSSGATTTRPR